MHAESFAIAVMHNESKPNELQGNMPNRGMGEKKTQQAERVFW